MKKLGGFLTNLIIVVLVLIIGFSVYSRYLYAKEPNKVPMPLGINILTVLTGSMQPELMPGDKILIRQTDIKDLAAGDIITFYMEGSQMVVTHRIIEVVKENGETTFITRGDYNNAADTSPVSSDQIIGKLIFSIAPLNAINRSFINGTWPLLLGGALFLIAIVAGLLIFTMVREKDKKEA